MPIRRGTYYARTFLLTQPNGAPQNITGWTFESDFKPSEDEADTALVKLTTANGGWQVTDGRAGKLLMQLFADDTNALIADQVYWDVLRTDPDPSGPIWLFEASVPVKD